MYSRILMKNNSHRDCLCCMAQKFRTVWRTMWHNFMYQINTPSAPIIGKPQLFHNNLAFAIDTDISRAFFTSSSINDFVREFYVKVMAFGHAGQFTLKCTCGNDINNNPIIKRSVR